MYNLAYFTISLLKRPLHHRHHSAPGVQKLHQHGQAVTGVIVLVFTRLHKQRHLVHERTVFLGAVGFVNEIELLDVRCELDDSAQLALRSRRFFVLILMRTPSPRRISSTFSQ